MNAKVTGRGFFEKAACIVFLTVLIALTLPRLAWAQDEWTALGVSSAEAPALITQVGETDSDDTVFDDANSDEVRDYILAQLLERKRTFTVRFRCNADFDRWLPEDLFEGALEHTGRADAGDYISHQLDSWSSEAYVEYVGEDSSIANVTYTVDFNTTAEQEHKVDQKVAEILEELDLVNLGEYERAFAIYKYITTHVKYDYKNLNNDSYKLKYTAYAALFNGTAVCQGYAVLFYRLANECGISSRIVSGFTSEGNDGHAWNIVQLGGVYYNVDSTWDAEDDSNAYWYFLKCDASFSDHIRDGEYTSDEFYSQYPMADKDYPIPNSVANAKVTGLATKVYTSNPIQPRPTVTLAGKQLKYGVDYELYYDNNVKVGTATIIIIGAGNYMGGKLVDFKIKQAPNKATTKKTTIKKTLKSTTLKKKTTTIALPKCTAVFGKAKWKVVTKDSKKVLSHKNGKVRVKRSAKKGTYTIKLKASVASTKNYKAASTKVLTVKVVVK